MSCKHCDRSANEHSSPCTSGDRARDNQITALVQKTRELEDKIAHLENCFRAQSTCLMVAHRNAADRLVPFKELEKACRDAEHKLLMEHTAGCISQIPRSGQSCDCGYEAIWTVLEKLERQRK